MWNAIYVTGIVAACIMGVFYSISARRRGLHPAESRMILGKMNISLGLLLLLLGTNQFTFEDVTTIRVVVAIIMLIVGTTNLVLGFRNYLYYKKDWRQIAAQLNAKN
ncbi:YtpI family protein [Brevibacillus daliensis]|uniref:YtpI family protein n=1 Tax=Brevibacillus daliensis TaxID=2892995 RepID=UPI001E5B6D2B|nr:YtpI family protein [Brevibacillus daliensis]